MSKTTAYVMLICLIVSVLIEILFPQILVYEFTNKTNNLNNGLQSEIKGSIYAVGFWFPVLFASLAGLAAETFIQLSKNYRKK